MDIFKYKDFTRIRLRWKILMSSLRGPRLYVDLPYRSRPQEVHAAVDMELYRKALNKSKKTAGS